MAERSAQRVEDAHFGRKVGRAHHDIQGDQP